MPRQATGFADGQILIYCDDANNHFAVRRLVVAF
jgi:hypothetical protein